MEEINKLPIIKLSNMQMAKITWSFLWRYVLFGLFFVAFTCIGYDLQIHQIINFFNFLKSFQHAIVSIGYYQAISLYSFPLLFLTIIRSIVGFVVTYVIFFYVFQLHYKDFTLSLYGPASFPKKGVLHIAWAFYWRLLLLLSLYFTLPLVFAKTHWMSSYIGVVIFGYSAVFFVSMIQVLKQIINKPHGAYAMIASKKGL